MSEFPLPELPVHDKFSSLHLSLPYYIVFILIHQTGTLMSEQTVMWRLEEIVLYPTNSVVVFCRFDMFRNVMKRNVIVQAADEAKDSEPNCVNMPKEDWVS